jgi:DNA-binding CsgD family transcriptional regulator
MSLQPNRTHARCPLTPALKTLLETAIELRTTNNKILAERLCVSEETVKSSFRRMGQLLDTHSRSETLLHALLSGWVLPPSLPIQGQTVFAAPRRHVRRPLRISIGSGYEEECITR